MKVLVTYCPTSDSIDIVAKEIVTAFSGEGHEVDIEKITPVKEHSGLARYIFRTFGFLLNAIRPTAKQSRDVSKYDLLVLGSPVREGRLVSPVNAYLNVVSGPGRAFAFVNSDSPDNKGALDVLTGRLREKGFSVVGAMDVQGTNLCPLTLNQHLSALK